MIRLTVDDEAHALSAWPNKAALHVGVDVIYAPRWATHVWLAPDGHSYCVNESDFAQVRQSRASERFKQLHR